MMTRFYLANGKLYDSYEYVCGSDIFTIAKRRDFRCDNFTIVCESVIIAITKQRKILSTKNAKTKSEISDTIRNRYFHVTPEDRAPRRIRLEGPYVGSPASREIAKANLLFWFNEKLQTKNHKFQ